MRTVLKPGMKLTRHLPYGARMLLLFGTSVSTTIALTCLVGHAHAPTYTHLWILSLGSLATQAYLATCYIRTWRNSLRVLQGGVAQLSTGNLAAKLSLRKTDELLTLGKSLGLMADRLSGLVSDVRSNASMVTQAGLQLTENTRKLAERTESQAASLQESSATMSEVCRSAHSTADRALKANALADEVLHQARGGVQAVQGAVCSMQEIQDSSRKVQDIIAAIEGLAFQTNILALNAAVEAARAGDQGRGFAVVAAEVRALALRSSESAHEIRKLIGESSERVERGVAQIGSVHDTFEHINEGVVALSREVQAISSNATEQSANLQQITQAITQLEEITHENAHMVEDASHQSGQLGERAQYLASAISGFELRQGCADEAIHLVRQASMLLQQQPGQALATITQESKVFADRDMYVFAFDRLGIYQAYAGRPEKLGTSVRDVPGVDGDKLVKDAFYCAKHGGGWVDYEFANPISGCVDHKSSYVLPVGGDMIVGCGIYKSRGVSPDQQTWLATRLVRSEHLNQLLQHCSGPAASRPGPVQGERSQAPARQTAGLRVVMQAR